MADISTATHDTMLAAVKAVKDTYPNTYYIQRCLQEAMTALRAAFNKRNDADQATPNAADVISPTADPHNPYAT
jgi:hypothetical protein